VLSILVGSLLPGVAVGGVSPIDQDLVVGVASVSFHDGQNEASYVRLEDGGQQFVAFLVVHADVTLRRSFDALTPHATASLALQP
jgi:hypothetical protein